MTKNSKDGVSTRRRFLKTAAAGAAATVAAPAIVSAQGATSMRWQSTWPAKDIFHEYALDFAKKVNDMTGGDLKIEVLPAGAVVPAFGLLDAVSKGTLDGGHGVLAYHYGKQNALALWGSGPATRWTPTCCWPGTSTVAARSCSKSSTPRSAPTSSRPYGPMPTQPLGWYKKPVTKVEDFQGMKFRTVGISDRRVHRTWRCGQRAARRRNRLGDGPWPARCGRVQQCELGSRARLRRRLQGLHAAELSPERRAVRDHVQQGQVRRAAGEDEGDHRQRRRCRRARTWPGRRSTATRRTTRSCRPRTRSSSTRRRTRCCRSSSTCYDQVAEKKAAENPLFKEIVESQLAFAKRATQWEQDTVVSRRMAYNHYFGPNAKKKT